MAHWGRCWCQACLVPVSSWHPMAPPPPPPPPPSPPQLQTENISMLATLLTTLSHPPPAGVSSVGAGVGVVGDVGDGDGGVSTRCVADEMSVWLQPS